MEPQHIQFIAPPGHLQAIGLIATCWSKLEWLVEEVIWQLGGLDDSFSAHILTAELGIRTRFDTMLALADYKINDTPQEAELQQIQKRVVSGLHGKPSLSSERNRVIHAYWSAGEGPLAFSSSIKARGKLRFDIKMMSESELLDIAKSVFAEVIRLDQIQEDLAAMGFTHPNVPG